MGGQLKRLYEDENRLKIEIGKEYNLIYERVKHPMVRG